MLDSIGVRWRWQRGVLGPCFTLLANPFSADRALCGAFLLLLRMLMKLRR